MENDINDGVILAARLFLAPLFLIFGWRKLTDYSGTVNRMVQDGAPFPVLATAIAIFMELPVAFGVAVGVYTRPSAVLLALYTLGSALIAHRYWTMTGANKIDSMESFYKNLSIVGGFPLLCITGAGRIVRGLFAPSKSPLRRETGTNTSGPPWVKRYRLRLLPRCPILVRSSLDSGRTVDTPTELRFRPCWISLPQKPLGHGQELIDEGARFFTTHAT
jgi:putative oxidoreductase